MAIKRIVDSFGKFLTLSEETRNFTKANYVKICMELDISKDLPKFLKFTIGNKTYSQSVVYDNNVLYCKHCLLRGHNIKNCFKANPDLRKKTRTYQETGQLQVSSDRV